MTSQPNDGVAASIDATYAIRQPAEHCGHILRGIVDADHWTECVLRLGHQGSHANHEGARWIERPADGYCPHCGRGDCAPTADEYEASQRRTIRIQTLLDDTRDRVRKLATRIALDSPWGRQTAAQILAALEPPKEQPQ